MSIPKHYPFINVKAVKAKIWRHKKPKEIHITARTTARTLLALSLAGTQGVTALEISSWAFRLGAYVYTLKHQYGLDIQTIREAHPHGWHGRYILHTPVEVMDIEFDK